MAARASMGGVSARSEVVTLFLPVDHGHARGACVRCTRTMVRVEGSGGRWVAWGDPAASPFVSQPARESAERQIMLRCTFYGWSFDPKMPRKTTCGGKVEVRAGPGVLRWLNLASKHQSKEV